MASFTLYTCYRFTLTTALTLVSKRRVAILPLISFQRQPLMLIAPSATVGDRPWQILHQTSAMIILPSHFMSEESERQINVIF